MHHFKSKNPLRGEVVTLTGFNHKYHPGCGFTPQVDGSLYVVYNVGLSSQPVGELEFKVNDGKYHVLRFTRSGQNGTVQLDDRPPLFKHPPGRLTACTTVMSHFHQDTCGRETCIPDEQHVKWRYIPSTWALALAFIRIPDTCRRIHVDGLQVARSGCLYTVSRQHNT